MSNRIGRMLHYARLALTVLRRDGPRVLVSKVRRRLQLRAVVAPKSVSPLPIKNGIGAILPRSQARIAAISIPSISAIVDDQVSVAALVHCFYPELLPKIIEHLKNSKHIRGVFVTTDTEAKRTEITGLLTEAKFDEIEVIVTENRGRDIAPRLLNFSHVYRRYQYFIHLHTKKSPHDTGRYGSWFEDTLKTLLPSDDGVCSILTILTHDNVGIVYPTPPQYVKDVLNWGYDFPHARDILKKLGIDISIDHYLEFPAGSMFWGRSAAIMPLLELGLKLDDFEAESGQVDGTLAHALERIVLYVCELTAHRWAQVTIGDRRGETIDVEKEVARSFVSLLDSWRIVPRSVERAAPETFRLLATLNSSPVPRLNLVIPTVAAHQTYGGISTAIRVFDEISSNLDPEWYLRVLVTDTPVSGALPSRVSEYQVTRLGKEPTGGRKMLIDCTDRGSASLEVSQGDVFMSTSWWTAHQVLELRDYQKSVFRRANRMLYLIQDFEPGFYGWSSRQVSAEQTYRGSEDSIALINSEELTNFMLARYRFNDAYLLPYSPLGELREATNVARQNILLFYARPSTDRNCFDIGCDGIRLWQSRFPDIAADWQIRFIGEDFDLRLTAPISNASVGGKMSLSAYADLLRRSKVGLSLMVSPHPSYPPLEMAISGVTTITNSYDGKDLSARSPRIVSLSHLDARSICNALNVATRMQAHIRTDDLGSPPNNSKAKLYDARAIAASLRADFELN